jgi:hypothetical protein
VVCPVILKDLLGSFHNRDLLFSLTNYSYHSDYDGRRRDLSVLTRHCVPRVMIFIEHCRQFNFLSLYHSEANAISGRIFCDKRLEVKAIENETLV